MPFLERTAQLTALEALLNEAARGRGRLVSIVGEAGAGKSTLAQAAASAATGRVRVLTGACEDLATPEPLGPLHDFASSAGWPAPAHATTQLGLFHAVLGQLMAEPTLLVLEDLHWADDATLDFVRFLGRRIRDTTLMALVTARNDSLDAQSRLRRALVDVPPEVCSRIEVPPLSQSAVREMARAYRQDGDRVFALTEGNAFLVTEVLRSGEECPATVRDALLLRAERLSPRARKALDAAAIFPRRVETWLLEMVCGAESYDQVSECVSAGILTGDEGFYAFRHELARRAIEAAMTRAALAKLNRCALAALSERMPSATARLVHHAAAAGDAGAVLALAPRAAEEASRVGAHRQAAQHYAAALELADTLPPEQRAELYERSAFERQLTGRVADAIEARKLALALRRQCGDALAVGDGLRWLGRLHYNFGDRAASEEYAIAAVEALEPLGPGPELAMAYANCALIMSLVDNRAAAVEWAGKTIDLASKLDRPDILADALATLGVANQWVDLAAARADFGRSLTLALELNRDELVARIYTNASCVEFNAREDARARRLLQAGIAYCTERDLDTWIGYMSGWLAELLVRRGQWDEARDMALNVVEGPFVSRVLRFPAVAALARLRMRAGEGDPRALLADLTFGAEPQRLLIYAPMFGELAWLADAGGEEALRLLDQAAPVAEQIGNVWAAGEIAYWRRKLGVECRTPRSVAAPYRLQFAGDWEGAAAAWAALPAPHEQALALLEGDELARARGLAVLDALGARATAERARRELRQRGVRGIARGPRPSTRANAAGLTRRQMDVLRLIDRGLSNGEIAKRLCVSVKTVDHHVSAILSKLDAHSRGEAAARARQTGLMGSERS